MKEILLSCLFILLSFSLSWGISFQWDYTLVPELAGFNAYDITTTRIKINTTIIPPSLCAGGSCTWLLPIAPVENHKYVVTAYGTGGQESVDSNILIYHRILSAPAGLIWKMP